MNGLPAREHVAVLGASGGVGRAIVAALLARGHRVAAVARRKEPLQALAERLAPAERLSLLPRPIVREADAAQLARELRALKQPVTAVVSALRGNIGSARLLDRSGPDLLGILEQELVTPFLAAKHLLPLLTEARPGGGHYLLLSGPMAACAWSGYGHVSIAAAGLQMLMRVLREEAKELPVAVQQLQIGTPVRSEANQDCACPEWIGADDVAERVVELVERRDNNIPIVELGTYRAARRTLSA